MELITRKLDAELISRSEYISYAEIERAGRYHYTDHKTLLSDLRRFEVYACYDGDKMAAFIMLNLNCRYFGGSIGIEKIRLSWEYNRDDVLAFMIRSALDMCHFPAGKMVTIDVDKKNDPNLELYHHMGFADSFLMGRFGVSHVVMVAGVEKITG